MAQNIVQGLFGPTPWELQQQQQQALDQASMQYAQMQPLQRATAGMFRAGGQIAGLGADAAGWVNPQVQQAQQREAIMRQNAGMLDSPEGARAAAKKFLDAGDQRTAFLLIEKAKQMEMDAQDLALKRAQELAQLKKAQSEASPLAKLAPKDYTPESWAEYVQTGDTSRLRAVPDAAKTPSSVQEYQFALSQGYRGSYEQWVKDKARAGAASTTVKLGPQENEFEKELGKGQAKALLDSKQAAEDAVSIMETVQVGKNLLDKGVITGFGADALRAFGSALNSAGITLAADPVANTEAYGAAMAQNVAKIIKQFGAGTGLSDADREYAQKMAGGQITLTEASLRKILQINEALAANVVAKHNAKVKGVKTNIPLEVTAPVIKSNVVNQIPGSIGTPPPGAVRRKGG